MKAGDEARGASEVAADLRRIEEHYAGFAQRTAREAAALLESLDDAARAAHDLLPDCPTCGGKGHVAKPSSEYPNGRLKDCPDCTDGKVSPARLAALWRAVQGVRVSTDGNWVHTPEGMAIAAVVLLNYLRSVKP